MPRRGLTLLNARLGPNGVSSLRLEGARIAALGAPPQPGDAQLDLQGERVLPGLINAHDHLQLNNFPRLQYRGRYANAAQWIEDIRPRLDSDPALIACRAVPREQRLWLGGIKNLLSGVTTVAHHDPLYPPLLDAGFPTRVVRDYGWSHSLAMDGEEAVRRAYRETPAEQPWIIHAAEGVDALAAAEFERLDTLGCLGANTLLVHGVALDRARQARLADAGAGLIWCPSSNLHLFGRTLDMRDLLMRQRVALGSDSRLSGGWDLLAELHLAQKIAGLDEASLESLVTVRAAQLLRLEDRGVLAIDKLADILVLPAGLPLSQVRRSDIRLVLIGGAPRYADEDYAQVFDSEADYVRVRVDGRIKCLARPLFARLAGAQAHEPGLEPIPVEAMA